MGATTLCLVAERAAELVPAFLGFTESCAVPDEPLPAIAREGHRIATEFSRLLAFVQDEAPVPGFEAERTALVQALSYHCMVAHDALRLAFPKVRTSRTEAARRTLGAVSPTTVELLALRDRLGR